MQNVVDYWRTKETDKAPAVAAIPLPTPTPVPTAPPASPNAARLVAFGLMALLTVGVAISAWRTQSAPSRPLATPLSVTAAPVVVAKPEPLDTPVVIGAAGPRRLLAPMPVALPTNAPADQPTMTVCCDGVCTTMTTTAQVRTFHGDHQGQQCAIRGQGWTAEYQQEWYRTH